MDSEFWAAVTGALVGAFAGGGVTWLLQHLQLKADSLSRDQALARSLVFKLIRIHSDLEGLRRHVSECTVRAQKLQLALGWQSLRPIGSLPDRVAFSPDEMSFLLGLRNYELFNDVVSLDVLHASTMGMFEIYAARRLELTGMLPAAMNELVGEVVMDDAAHAYFAPRAAELDDLARQIRGRVEDDAADAKDALIRTADAVTATLGSPLILEFKDSDIAAER